MNWRQRAQSPAVQNSFWQTLVIVGHFWRNLVIADGRRNWSDVNIMSNERRPKEKREFINELEQKFEAVRRELGFSSANALMDAVIEAHPAAKLKGREFRRQVFEDRKINSTYQQSLGEFAEFDWRGYEWREGDCGSFLAAWAQRKQATDLIEDVEFVDDDRIATDLAMLTLFAPTNAPPVPPGQIYVSFALNCPEMRDTGYTCGVRSGWLQFNLDKGQTSHAKDRTGFGTAVQFDNAKFSVQDPDHHRPSWLANAADGQIIGMVADVPADFLLAHGLRPGQKIRTEFQICVSEVGISFVLPEGKKESAAKTKLKQRLKQRQIIDDDDGKATIAAVSIRLIAKHDKRPGGSS